MKPVLKQTLLQPSEPVSRQFKYAPFQRFNHNVVVCWGVQITAGLADNVWSGTVLANYVYDLMGQSNAYAGYVEAAQGAANLLVALPIGVAADKGSKSRIIAFGGMMIPVAVAATSFAVVYGTSHVGQADARTLCFGIFILALCLWGVVGAVINGPCQALYADSIPRGQRSRFYHILFSLYLLSSMLGPGISILLFQIHGNKWRLPDLRNVFLAGLGLELLVIVGLVSFRDSCALPAERTAEKGTPTRVEGAARSGSGFLATGNSSAAIPPLCTAAAAVAAVDDGTCSHAAVPDGQSVSSTATTVVVAEPKDDTQAVPHAWMIPWLIFTSGLTFALGSGMTVKFFPLFFRKSCRMSPIGVQMIYVLVPLLMVGGSAICTPLSQRFGRAQTMVALKVVGVGLLVTMALLSIYWLDTSSLTADHDDVSVSTLQVVVMVSVYLVRTSLMNCTYPIEESILMDFVPPDTRARWKALESVGVFGWCGSAALGGVLADAYGYSFTFLITAAVQAVAVLIQSLLIFIVPRNESQGTESPPLQVARASPVLEPLIADGLTSPNGAAENIIQ